MSKNFVETIVGAIVLIVASYFLYYAYTTTQVISHSSTKNYTIIAKFDRIDGLKLGSDVKISGIKVGKVISQELDNKTFKAILNISLIDEIKLPADTSAEIVTNGFLGDKYISLVPGSDDELIADKGEIEFTQSPISLEGLIGKFLFSSASSGAKNSSELKQPIDIEKKSDDNLDSKSLPKKTNN